MMTERDREFAWLQACIGQVTYKPGWSFEPRTFDWGYATDDVGKVHNLTGCWVHLSVDTGDADRRKETFRLGWTRKVPAEVLAARNPVGLMLWLREQVKRLEMHEMTEWLRVGGSPVIYPHPAPGCTTMD